MTEKDINTEVVCVVGWLQCCSYHCQTCTIVWDTLTGNQIPT